MPTHSLPIRCDWSTKPSSIRTVRSDAPFLLASVLFSATVATSRITPFHGDKSSTFESCPRNPSQRVSTRRAQPPPFAMSRCDKPDHAFSRRQFIPDHAISIPCDIRSYLRSCSLNATGQRQANSNRFTATIRAPPYQFHATGQPPSDHFSTLRHADPSQFNSEPIQLPIATRVLFVSPRPTIDVIGDAVILHANRSSLVAAHAGADLTATIFRAFASSTGPGRFCDPSS